MNKHKNGTIKVGAEGSYQRRLTELTDICKNKNVRVYEVYHQMTACVEAGTKIGITQKKINNDMKTARYKAYQQQ